GLVLEFATTFYSTAAGVSKSQRSSMRRAHCSRFQRSNPAFVGLVAILLTFFPHGAGGQDASLELSRPVRSWEFLPAVGTRAGLFGNEAGRLEAWVYPLKIFRDFHLLFHTDGRVLPAESLARTVTVHPESCSILYAGDTFQVREMLFVPLREPGARSEEHTSELQSRGHLVC